MQLSSLEAVETSVHIESVGEEACTSDGRVVEQQMAPETSFGVFAKAASHEILAARTCFVPGLHAAADVVEVLASAVFFVGGF